MAQLSVAEVLSRAADLIEPEGKWTQGCLFRDAEGKGLRPSDSGKSCFCMAGALVQIGGPWASAWNFLDDALPKVGFGNRTGAWNDAPERTQAEVVAKLREAAELARQRGL